MRKNDKLGLVSPEKTLGNGMVVNLLVFPM
jgi:hypothetical protein